MQKWKKSRRLQVFTLATFFLWGDDMVKPNIRKSSSTKRIALRKRVAALGLPCALCGKAIDYSLPAGHPLCYELDEIIPVSKGGSPFDRDNVQPAHRICNQRRGNKPLNLRSKVLPPVSLTCSQKW